MNGSVPAAVHVIGLGNSLRGDDGFGSEVVERLLQEWAFPSGVILTAAGTPGLDLTALFSGFRHLLLIDAVRGPGAPGAVGIYSEEDLETRLSGSPLTSHGPGVVETLRLLRLTGGAPETVTLFGVVPLSVERGIGLTAPVRDAVEVAARAVVRRLVALGFPVALHAPRASANSWQPSGPVESR